MMYIFLAFFLPLAYGFTTLDDSPCYEFEDPVCGKDPQDPYDMFCPSSVDFNTGCPNGPGTCHESVKYGRSDYDGNACPNSCPVDCDWTKGQLPCPSTPVNGCPGEMKCLAPTKNHFDGSDCYTGCPPMCYPEDGQVYCPGPVDWMGCETVGSCAYPSWNGCPAVCDVHCDYNNGEIMCDNGYDENFCYLGSYCMAPAKDNFGGNCYATCPPVCKEHYGEVFCPGGFDSYSGCEMPGYCAYPQSTECPALCYPTCDYENGERYCDNGYDDNGCSLGGYCAVTC